MIDLMQFETEEDTADALAVLEIFQTAFTFEEKVTLEEYLRAGHVTLSSESGKGGPFDLEARPYQLGPVRAWELYKHIVMVWGAQTGKSAVPAALMCYLQDLDPTTIMIGFPDRTTGGRRSRVMYMPTIRASRVAAKLPGTRDDLVTYEYTFNKGRVLFAWAGSSSSLAAETARVMIAEEAAKWRQRDKGEGDPLLLFWRRGIDWGDLARRVIPTTPSFDYAHGWLEFLGGTQHRLFVPCPHCGDPEKLAHVGNPETRLSVDDLKEDIASAGYQVLEWKTGPEGEHGITGWGKERDPDTIRKMAGYRCVHCGEIFSSGDKNRMMPDAKWIPIFPKRETFSCQLPSWYSPSVTFGDVAARFFEAQVDKDPAKMQDWTNSDAANPWVESGADRKEEHVKMHRREYGRGTMPFRPLAVVMTVDVQAGELYYEVGAHGEGNAYAEITHGKLPRQRTTRTDGTLSTGLDVLDPVRNRMFECTADGQRYGVQALFIDCNYDEEEVWAWCRERGNCFPVQGRDNQMVPVRYVFPDQRVKTDGTVVKDTTSLMVTQFSSHFFKTGWAGRWDVNPEDPGAWWLNGEEDAEYEHQLCGEYKAMVSTRHGRSRYVWKQRWENHYFDCSYYQHVAAYVLDVRSLTLDVEEDEAPGVEEAEAFEQAWATDL